MAGTSVGQRNNNYLDVKSDPSKPWIGLNGIDEHGHAIFIWPKYGLRAAILTLRTYWFSYALHTVSGIIRRWAPPDDTIGSIPGNPPNDPSDYTNFVCQQIKFGLNQDLELFHPDKTLGNVDNLERLIDAMAKFEISADFTFPRQEFLDAVKLVQPDFNPPEPPPPAPQANGAPPPNNVAVPADAAVPEHPLKDLAEPVLEQLKKTTIYELVESLLTSKATAAPAVNKSAGQAHFSRTTRNGQSYE